MNVLAIKLQTRTPLWTGGIDGKTDRLHETGIIGSLRWWYEAIVRGLGHYACDPVGGNGCQYDPRKKASPEEQLCPACYIFGATGWRRRFRLDVLGWTQNIPFGLLTLDNDDPSAMNHWWLSKIFEKSIGSKLPAGQVTLQIVGGNSIERQQILATLALIQDSGALGAKPQYGFGQVDIEDKLNVAEGLLQIRNFLDSYRGKRLAPNSSNHTSLADLWTYRLKIPNDHGLVNRWRTQGHWVGDACSTERYLPVSFDIRYRLPGHNDALGLRTSYREATRNKYDTRDVFGYMQGEKSKQRSRVFVSHLFRDSAESPFQLRVWGFTNDGPARQVGKALCSIFRFSSVTRRDFQTRTLSWKSVTVQLEGQ